MNDDVYSLLVGTAGLGVLALVALWLTLLRRPGPAEGTALRRLLGVGALAVVCQIAHFTEELVTGFYEHFPRLLGLKPFPEAVFVGFNLFWIAAWGLSLVGVHRHLRAAFFPLWFLGLASVFNGLAHPCFALVTGGYFPGLWTTPLVGLAGLGLLRRLAAYTRADRLPARPA